MTAQNQKRRLDEHEEIWLPARLIPTSGIKGVDEQEKRATSALLSVMMAVPEFGRAIVQRAGAPRGKLKAYIEPPFKSTEGRKVQPDGALVVRRGSQSWCALVEVKAEDNELRREQIDAYLDLVRDENFDALITVSSQISTATDAIPYDYDRKKIGKRIIRHYSWMEILTEAVMIREHQGISDPDQAWILGELIAYLQHPASGALQFQDMGPKWVTVREQARAGMLQEHDDGVREIAAKWDQFIQFVCLHLSGELGVEVTHLVQRDEKADRVLRRQNVVRQLVHSGLLTGTIAVKNAAGPITLQASLPARTVTASVTVDAPGQGKPTTRVSWLIRQLRDVESDLVIHSSFSGSRATNSALLSGLREDSSALLLGADPTRSPKAFIVSLTRDMGLKRGAGKDGTGSFVGEATQLLLSFYRNVVQSLRPWATPPPRLPDTPDVDDSAHQPENVVEQAAIAEATAAALGSDSRQDGSSAPNGTTQST